VAAKGYEGFVLTAAPMRPRTMAAS
jgi:hypothetical protein